MDRPKPAPGTRRPTSDERRKGRNTASRSLAGMPGPALTISMRPKPSSRAYALTRMGEKLSPYLKALASRLLRIWASRTGSALTAN